MPAVIICPGGGYEKVAYREGEPLALAFLAQGYQAFVLDYSVMNKGRSDNFLADCLKEVTQSFELVRENADKWELDKTKIALLGCSAGGHLAAWYAGVAKIKPASLVLCYPVTAFDLGYPQSLKHFPFPIKSADYDTTAMIGAEQPATFVWHTANDEGVPVQNSLKYCEKLARLQVDFEAHCFEKGPHGLSLATRGSAPSEDYLNGSVAQWFGLALDFLARHLEQ